VTPERRRVAGALGLALLFFAAGAYHIGRPGLQADEALFAQGVWESGTVELFTRVFGWRVPLMQMPYLGSLKSILYQPVFALFGASAASVRLPIVAAAAATVALTFLMLWRLRGERAAWIGGALLATDPTFFFTTRCDWGPVALERLLTVGGVSLFVRGRIAWGALLFGLALWNKTTFLWTLIGLGVGVAALYPSKLRLRPATLALALVCFAAGAYPWIRYNVRSQGATAKATAHLDTANLGFKLNALHTTLVGAGFYGYLVRDHDVSPLPRRNITPWLAACGVMAALLFRDRLALFFLVSMSVAWLSMALTPGGASAHHIVLLWPWPHCLIALAAARRRAFVAVAMLGALISAGVIVRHYALFDRYGSDPPWSEAIYPLAERVQLERPAGVFVADWGILDQILLLSRGQLPLEIAFHRHQPPEYFAGRPGWIFVSHVDTREEFKGINATWKQVPGYRRITIGFVRDRQGFPIYELFRFEPQ
jgi:hypothetical protein